MSASAYEYAVLRWVPRAEREEFVNVGVVLHCRDADLLLLRCAVDADRLAAFAPRADLAPLRTALGTLEAVCRGDASGGPASGLPLGPRFGWVVAPRSTVLRAGPVHGGRTTEARATADHLLARLVG